MFYKKNLFSKFLFLMLILFAVAFVGCGNESGADNIPSDNSGEINEDSDRKVYYSVDYRIKTKNINRMTAEITKKVRELKGYINDSYQKESYARFVYRVPVDKLDEFMDYMSNINDVVDKSLSSDDITNEYSYTDERLKTLYATKASYINLLSNDSLTIEEIISIKSRIEDVDTEIKVLENRKSSYNNLLNYSTVVITFDSSKKISASFFKDYAQYLNSFVAGLFKFIMYVLPFGIVGGGISLIIYLLQEKATKKKIEKRMASSRNTNDGEEKKQKN